MPAPQARGPLAPPDPQATVSDETRPVPVVPTWVTVSRPRGGEAAAYVVRPRRIVAQLVAGVLLVLAVVVVLGTLAASRLAEREAVNDAAHTADILAESVVQPALTEGLADGNPADVTAFDTVIRQHVLGADVVRVKIWNPAGTVIYSDDVRVVGRTFGLDDEERSVLATPHTEAEVSDLSQPENEFETASKLLEVYRPVWTASGRELLFEIYAPYEPVQQRADQMARGFLGVMLSSLLLLLVLLAPVVWRLLSRLRQAQGQREHLLQRAVDASADERRRIAASLHDGPVQELVATSYAVSGAAAHAESAGRAELARELSGLATGVRGNIRVLRTLLVDIYPPSLGQAGVAAALGDLAQVVRPKGVDVRLDVDAAVGAGLEADDERLVYRVAQECLRNVATHAAPCTATVSLTRSGTSGEQVVLDIVDDGRGFDTARLATPEHGHFGLQVLADLASDAGAHLEVASAPGAGAHWRLTLDPGVPYDDRAARRRPPDGAGRAGLAARRRPRPRGRRSGGRRSPRR